MILGHDRQINFFKSRFSSGACHHAWLLKGQKGIGKYKIALEFAKHILNCDADLGVHSHPDLKIISKKDEKAPSVEDVRNSLGFLNQTTVDGGWKVFLIDSMGELNTHSQNALLKMLEEPRPRTLFLIVLHDGEQMLSTIKSRVIPLTFSPLPKDVILKYMNEHHKDAPLEYIPLACGSIGRLEEMIAKEGIEVYQFIIDCLLDGRQFSFAQLAIKHSPLFLAQMMTIVYHRLILAHTGQMVDFVYKNEKDDLGKVMQKVDWRKMGCVFTNVRRVQNLHLEPSSLFLG